MRAFLSFLTVLVISVISVVSSQAQCLKIQGSGSSAKIVITKLNKKKVCPANTISIAKILKGSVTELNGAAAGGSLEGTYPNPALANGVVSTINFANLPNVRAKRASTQSIPNATSLGAGASSYEILLDSVIYDSGGNYSAEQQRIVVPVAGTYLVTGHISWTANASGRRMAIIQPGSPVVGSTLYNIIPGFSSPVPNIQTFSHIVKLAAGDSLKLFASQDSGASISLGNISIGYAELTAQWLAP